VIKPYHDVFMERSVAKGYDKQKMEVLWAKMEAFALYAFNRSHAACYAITGYYSQWFKSHFPLQFWTVSLQYEEDDKKIAARISEIQKTSDIKVSPVDINKSDIIFRGDTDTNSIYWALPSVKYVGDKVVESIFSERNTNGDFFSLEEFYIRTKGAPGINKRAIINLIISGAFDLVEKLNSVTDRYQLIEKYHDLTATKISEENELMKDWVKYQWTLKQKELTGFGIFDFNEVIHQSELVGRISKYQENSQLLSLELENFQEVMTVGLLVDVIERKSKNGPFAQLEIRDNTDSIYITMWNEVYAPLKTKLSNSMNRVILLTGKLGWDDFKKMNSITTDKFSKVEII